MMTENDLAGAIADNVRAGRKRMGLSRRQLAERAHVSERYLNQLENGAANVSVGILARIADALETDVMRLVAPAAPEPAASASQPLRHAGLLCLLTTMSLAEQAGAMPVLERYLAERRRNAKGLALMGLRGAGKSTLGLRLSERFGCPYVSITREIESRAGMNLGDLFNLGGPDAYRALENEVVDALTRRPDRVVLETAGGIVGNAEALDKILASFRTVWLKASPEEHLARVAGQGDTRPMQGNPKALDQIRALLAAREPEYARAECVLDTSGRTVAASLADLERIAEPVFASATA
jgi:XRE family aerobic/anaerobic benzoate catabolism transcriptional regulator